jgi:hypothetical protein
VSLWAAAVALVLAERKILARKNQAQKNELSRGTGTSKNSISNRQESPTTPSRQKFVS